MTDTIRADRVMTGENTFTGVVNLPAATIGNAEVKTGSVPVQAVKLEHQFPVHVSIVASTVDSSTAASAIIHIARAAGRVVQFTGVHNSTVAVAGRVLIDLLSGSSGVAYATMLSTQINMNSTSPSAREAKNAVVATSTYSAGDSLQYDLVSTQLAAGDLRGLSFTLWLKEDPT